MAAALARHSLHPVSRTLASAQRDAGVVQVWTCEAVTEHAGQGVAGVAISTQPGGAVESRSLRLGSTIFCNVEHVNTVGAVVHLSDETGWLASFELKEDVRELAAETVASLQKLGVSVSILSGDRSESVARIAALAGITRARGGCAPDDKLAYIRKLQAQGHQVAMVGDGLNDGPVLAGANVSFAFGQGAPLAHAKADFVILGEQLMSVVQTVALSRRTLRIVRQNLWWALLYNAACVPLAIAGLLPAWLAGLGMASSSLLVVLNALRLTRPQKLLKEP